MKVMLGLSVLRQQMEKLQEIEEHDQDIPGMKEVCALARRLLENYRDDNYEEL